MISFMRRMTLNDIQRDQAAQRHDALAERVLAARASRRTILRRAVALGLSVPVVGGLLAACGGDDDPTATTAPPPAATTAPAPPATTGPAPPARPGPAAEATRRTP